MVVPQARRVPPVHDLVRVHPRLHGFLRHARERRLLRRLRRGQGLLRGQQGQLRGGGHRVDELQLPEHVRHAEAHPQGHDRGAQVIGHRKDDGRERLLLAQGRRLHRLLRRGVHRRRGLHRDRRGGQRQARARHERNLLGQGDPGVPRLLPRSQQLQGRGEGGRDGLRQREVRPARDPAIRPGRHARRQGRRHDQRQQARGRGDA